MANQYQKLNVANIWVYIYTYIYW